MGCVQPWVSAVVFERCSLVPMEQAEQSSLFIAAVLLLLRAAPAVQLLCRGAARAVSVGWLRSCAGTAVTRSRFLDTPERSRVGGP